ncbi:MAG: serine/threonine protein kinase [Planctomycetia bacterium]|nr:serine/threonine protein kinase [Planctomycetia bacterium]
MSPEACPTPEQILAFLQSQLSENFETELAPLVTRIREPVPVNAFHHESECQEVIAAVAALATDPPGNVSDDGLAFGDGDRDGEDQELGALREYQLLERLGRGGMGTVYKALHTRLKRVVAVKVLPADRLNDPAAVARFQREMEAVGKLDHPNIVRATDAGEVDGIHFLVMEYVLGLDVSDLVRRAGPLPIAEACEIARQAAVGLQNAHEHGLVHRDIKPSNLMLTADGQIKILDLGLARLHDSQQGDLTSASQMMGTIDYMAPEQTSASRDVDIRADIFSLGATLYKLLCGQAPPTIASPHPRKLPNGCPRWPMVPISLGWLRPCRKAKTATWKTRADRATWHGSRTSTCHPR